MQKNFNFAIVDFEEGETKEILAKQGYGESNLPLIYGIDFMTSEQLIYNGKLEISDISEWMMQNDFKEGKIERDDMNEVVRKAEREAE